MKRMMRVVASVALAVSAFNVAGCSFIKSGPQPMAATGLDAYEGSEYVAPTSFLGLPLGAGNTVRTDNDRCTVLDRTPIRVFVAPAEVNNQDLKGNVIFNDTAGIARELNNALVGVLARHGRFEVVPSREFAHDLVVTAELSSMSVWGDWFRTDEELVAHYDPMRKYDTARVQDIAREGMDALLRVKFAWKDGVVFSSQTALGRMVSHRGEIVDRSRVHASGRSGQADQSTQLRQDAISETRLPQLFEKVVCGSVVLNYPYLDSRLWASAADPETGQRAPLLPNRGETAVEQEEEVAQR